ncbi:MAG TPA: hypothetical protein V6D16_18445 [Candidatus Obscuribacterales bacterium]
MKRKAGASSVLTLAPIPVRWVRWVQGQLGTAPWDCTASEREL